MINKYNNPRLHNTVLTGPGMAHPRNPHVVIGSDEQGFIQGDLMDANAIMETIDQKIDVDNLIDEEKLTATVQNAVDSILGDVSESLDTLKEVENRFSEIEQEIESNFSEVEQDISDKEDKAEIISASGTTLSPSVNKYYRFSEAVNTLTVTLPVPTDSTHVASVILYFTAGSNPNVTITCPSDVYYSDGFEIKADTTYEVNCLWNGASWVVASVTIIVE